MSTTLIPPMRLRKYTLPGCSPTTSPMIAASLPSGCARIVARTSLRARARDDGEEFSLVRDVERIESENFACAADRLGERNLRFVQANADRAVAAISFSVLASPPRVGSRKTCTPHPPHQQRAATMSCSGAESDSSAVSNSSPSRTDMIAMPCSAIAPLIRTTSPIELASATTPNARRNDADACRVDEHAVAFAAINDLGIACDNRHAHCARGRVASTARCATGLASATLPPESARMRKRHARRTSRDR